MDKKNSNMDRSRYYGKRIGDIVSRHDRPYRIGQIVELDGMDNNRCYVHWIGNREPCSDTAESMEIRIRAEELLKRPPRENISVSDVCNMLRDEIKRGYCPTYVVVSARTFWYMCVNANMNVEKNSSPAVLGVPVHIASTQSELQEGKIIIVNERR